MNDMAFRAIGAVNAERALTAFEDFDIVAFPGKQWLPYVVAFLCRRGGVALEPGGQQIGVAFEHFPQQRQ